MNEGKVFTKAKTFFKQPIIYIVAICVIIQLVIYGTVPKHEITSDTASYTEFFQIEKEEKNFFSRTPVYPYFIEGIRRLGGEENLLDNVATIQKFLFIVTLILLYECLKKVTKNEKVIAILTLVFGITPFVNLWNVMILAESLSIFEIVVLAFFTLKYLEKPNVIIAGSIRWNNINDDYDKTNFHIHITNIYIILDFKVYL